MKSIFGSPRLKTFIIIFWFPLIFGYLIFTFKSLYSYNRVHAVNRQPNDSVNSLLYSYVVTSHSPSRIEDYTPDKDVRIVALTRFFQDIHSPLRDYAEILVYQADVWGLDYALIPAISMQESGGCKRIPPDSYNCWGFGIYGTRITRFASYEEAITRIAKTIKEAYVKKGLTNATLVEDLWTPQSKGQWSYSVNYYIGKIKEYERLSTGT